MKSPNVYIYTDTDIFWSAFARGAFGTYIVTYDDLVNLVSQKKGVSRNVYIYTDTDLFADGCLHQTLVYKHAAM